MSKYLFLAAAMIVLAVACNKKEEAAPATETEVEQMAPAEEAPEDHAHDEAAPSEDAEEVEEAEVE